MKKAKQNNHIGEAAWATIRACRKNLSDKWTVHPRPYDVHFSYALRHFRSNQNLLVGCLMEFVLEEDDGKKSPAFLPKSKTGAVTSNIFDEIEDHYDHHKEEGDFLDEDGEQYDDDYYD